MKKEFEVINYRKDGTIIKDMSKVVLPHDLSMKVLRILDTETKERKKA